jgi:hypothetical protein
VPVLVAGKQITVPILEKNSFKDGVHISNRPLERGANEALKTIKKAVAAFVLPLLNDDGTLMQSGTTLDDIDAQVLNIMFVLLKSKNTVDDAEEDGAEDDTEAKSKEHGEGAAPNQASAIRPTNWFFHGWITFQSFGLMVHQACSWDPYLAKGVLKTSNG